MSTNGATVDQDDDDLSNERDLLAFLIEKLKCEIDDSKTRKDRAQNVKNSQKLDNIEHKIGSLQQKPDQRHAQPEDSKKLFQKLLEDLKELAEYKESLENSSKEIATLNSNQEKEEPPQDFDIRQLIREECGTEVSEEQKQNMEDTILELVEISRQKELLCMHDNVDDLIESALNSKLLSINSQQSLQNFRVIHKSSTTLKNTSQISPVHAIAPILSTKEPEYSPSMGYEHPNTTSEMESNEIRKSGVEELVLIPSECEVTSEDEKFDFDFEKEIHLIENLLYDNSSPRPPEELNTEIADTNIESLPLLPIPVQDGDSQREEIDIVTNTNDVLPPGFENDDSEEEIDVVDDLHVDNSISISKQELSDSEEPDFDNPSVPQPPSEPPDDDFDFKLDAGDEISVVMNVSDEL
nr:hypothetical protein [Tanacetum cinerariifolium]